MDKKFLKEHNLYEAVSRYRQLYEYINTAGDYELNEEGEDEMPMGGDEQPMMDGPDGGAPMGDPSMDGGMDQGPDGGGEMPAPQDGGDMGGAPMQGAEGFAPQGEEQPMGATPETDPNADVEEEEEEVIDVDDLTDSQEETEEKVDLLGDKFEKVLSMLDKINTQIENNDKRFEELRSDMEKRNPTPVEKMSLRSTKSGPYTQTPENYWETSAPENYSPEDDNNGADMPEYVITKDDIDNFRDWNGISKTFDEYPVSLKDFFGY